MRRRLRRRGLGILWGFQVPTVPVVSVDHTVPYDAHQVGVRMRLEAFTRKRNREKLARDYALVRAWFQHNCETERFGVHCRVDEKILKEELEKEGQSLGTRYKRTWNRDAREWRISEIGITNWGAQNHLNQLNVAKRTGLSYCSSGVLIAVGEKILKKKELKLSDAVLLAKIRQNRERRALRRQRVEGEKRKKLVGKASGQTDAQWCQEHDIQWPLNNDYETLIDQEYQGSFAAFRMDMQSAFAGIDAEYDEDDGDEGEYWDPGGYGRGSYY